VGGPTAPNQPPGGNGPPPAQPQPRNGKSDATPPDDLPPSNNPATLRGFAAMKQGDYNTAWREFMTGAQQQDAAAETALGAMLLNHMNPPGTGYYAQCEQWLLAAAKQGNAEGMYFLGRYYYESGRNIAGGINPGHNTAPIPPALQAQAEQKFRQSREWLEKSAALGNQRAMGNLAILVDAGLGGPADSDRAKELRAEAEQGPDKAFGQKIASMDPENEKIQAAWQAGHYADAMRDAQTRANQGNASAQALLCKAYYEGVGMQRNYATALTWCNRAVAQKNADAMFILGLMYEHGAGVNQDIPRSVKLFDQAASLGQSYARMEAKGMRMQGEANRTAAMSHGGVEETACGVAGGVSVGPECVRGGATIDPFDATKQ
jgi:TPR repeat protein